MARDIGRICQSALASEHVTKSSLDLTSGREDSLLSYQGNECGTNLNCSLWFSQETWSSHCSDLNQIRYTLQFIESHCQPNCSLCPLTEKAIRRTEKLSRLLELHSDMNDPKGGLVFSVSIHGITVKTYKQLWCLLLERITKILDVVTPGPNNVQKQMPYSLEKQSSPLQYHHQQQQQQQQQHQHHHHQQQSNDSIAMPVFVGLEPQFVCLIKFKDIIQSRAHSPWHVTDLSHSRHIILFELIRMDLKAKLSAIEIYLKESQVAKKKGVEEMFIFSRSIENKLTSVDLLKWMDLGYFISKTKLLLSKVWLIPVCPNDQPQHLHFHEVTLPMWLDYVKCLSFLIEPMCQVGLYVKKH